MYIYIYVYVNEDYVIIIIYYYIYVIMYYVIIAEQNFKKCGVMHILNFVALWLENVVPNPAKLAAKFNSGTAEGDSEPFARSRAGARTRFFACQ